MNIGLKRNLNLTIVLLVAVAIRVWGVRFGLPQRTHIDEPAYVLAALKIASGNFNIPYPTLSPNLYELILTFGYGALYAVYRIAGVYLSGLEFGRSYLVDPTPFYLLARLTSVLLSAIAVYITYLIGEKLIGKLGGILAALILAVVFIDVRHAHFAEPYALLSLFSITCAYFGFRFVENGKIINLVLSAGLAGMAFALRSSMALLFVIPVFSSLKRGSKNIRSLGDLGQYVRLIVPFAMSALVGFVLAYPGILIEPSQFLDAFRYYRDLASGAQGFQGFIFNPGSGWQFYFENFVVGLGGPLILASVCGLIIILLSVNHRRRWWLIISFPLIYMMLLGTSKMAFIRYSVPLMPYIALLAAVGVSSAYDYGTKKNKNLGWLLLITLMGLIIFIPLKNDVLLDNLLTRQDTRAIAKWWIESNLPVNSKIALQWFTPTLATENDPEPESSRIFRTFIIDPFVSNPDYYSIEYYRKNGFKYLIVSSFIYKLHRVDANDELVRKEFYASLDNQAKLIAEFKPNKGNAEIPFEFEEFYGPVMSLQSRDRPGPTIKVYQIVE